MASLVNELTVLKGKHTPEAFKERSAAEKAPLG